MALAYPTLHDIAVMNGSDPVVGLIDETMKAVPEVRLGAARPIKGTHYETLARTELPTVDFRAANQGTAATKGVYENRLVECFPMNPIWQADKAVADVYEDGAAAYIAMEGAGMTIAAFQHLGAQFYYGDRGRGRRASAIRGCCSRTTARTWSGTPSARLPTRARACGS